MRILIVDDEDQMRALPRLMLEPAGHEALDTANGIHCFFRIIFSTLW